MTHPCDGGNIQLISDNKNWSAMSSIVWDGDNLLQRVRNNIEELGHVKFDAHSKTVVLWLRDTQDVFGCGGGYIRGDEFPTMADAKMNAAGSVSASLLHHMWLVRLGKAPAMTGGVRDEPLTVSTFKEEMDKRDKRETRWKVVSTILAIVGVVFAVL